MGRFEETLADLNEFAWCYFGDGMHRRVGHVVDLVIVSSSLMGE